MQKIASTIFTILALMFYYKCSGFKKPLHNGLKQSVTSILSGYPQILPRHQHPPLLLLGTSSKYAQRAPGRTHLFKNQAG